MNVYLDIDGILLTKQQKIPEGAENLIRYLIRHCNCFWLTTHCRTGTNKAADYLSQFYSKEFIRCFETVEPTNWSTLKTEAIDFTKSFIWLEDYPFEAEKKVLIEKDQLEALILVDLSQKKSLERVLEIIKTRCEKG
jgi:hypothetical protein